MKIAIYGDSFAIDEENTPRKNSWVDHLSNHYDVVNYAKQGSSLYYSYKEFLRTHQYYDKVIFLVTNFGRLYVPNLPHPHIPGLYNVEKYLKESNSRDREKFQTIKNFFLHIQNESFEKDIHGLILKECMSLRPDCLFIPCFDQSLIPEWKFCTMMDIQIIDFEFYKINPFEFSTDARELRNCHMNDENNLIFYKKIKSWIEGSNFQMYKRDFSYPREPLEYYFINL